MNILIVYFSRFGNTLRLASAIAGVLAARGAVRTVSVDKLTADDLVNADLIVMGSPTHNTNLPKPVQAMLQSVPRKG